jgi:hypothetical protein
MMLVGLVRGDDGSDLVTVVRRPGIVLCRLTGSKGAALRRHWRDDASATLDPATRRRGGRV